ncbi:MAG: glycosyltransferase 87 family protein [Promethearchaeota archaeon]
MQFQNLRKIISKYVLESFEITLDKELMSFCGIFMIMFNKSLVNNILSFIRTQKYLLVTILGVAIRAVIGYYFYHPLDVPIFISAAKRLIDDNNPLDIYETKIKIGAQEFPFAQPPLVAFLILPLVLLADGTKWIYLAIKIPSIIADIICANLLKGHFINRGKENYAFRAYLYWLFNPITIFTTAYEGHYEAVLIMFFLLALRNNTDKWKRGIYLGFAFLVKLQAFIFLPPLIINSKFVNDLKGRFKILSIGLGIFILLCLPFLIADPENVIYSFFLHHAGKAPFSLTWWVFLLRFSDHYWKPGPLHNFVIFLLAHSIELTVSVLFIISYLTRNDENIEYVFLVLLLGYFFVSKAVLLRYFTLLIPWQILYEIEKREWVIPAFTGTIFLIRMTDPWQIGGLYVSIVGLVVSLICIIYFVVLIFENRTKNSCNAI